MNLELALKLIDKGIIHIETEIKAEYNAMDISGYNLAKVSDNFIILGIKKSENDVIFEVANTTTAHRRKIKCEAVTHIDGMLPAKLASVYNIKADGSKSKEAKRRGRKPKNLEE